MSLNIGVGGGSTGGTAVGATATIAGIAALPNTGDDKVFIATSVFSIIVGSLILISTIARFIIKKSLKA